MARDPKTPSSDVIRLLENPTVADREKVIAAAGQQRDARLLSGRGALLGFGRAGHRRVYAYRFERLAAAAPGRG
jgi:hypothetical protein